MIEVAVVARYRAGPALFVLFAVFAVVPGGSGAPREHGRLPRPSWGAASRAGLAGSDRGHSSCTAKAVPPLGAGTRADQLITVEAAGVGTPVAELELWQRAGACWAREAGPWPALIGRNGFSSHHREGDGTTPVGTYRLGATVYCDRPNPGYRGPYHRLVCGDWWDEDPTSREYNTFQHVACGQPPPFGGDSEALWTETQYYPALVVVEYNVNPAVPYAGSGIFVHASTGVPTTGCVSIHLPDLWALLRWLAPVPPAAIAMGPAPASQGPPEGRRRAGIAPQRTSRRGRPGKALSIVQGCFSRFTGRDPSLGRR
ncbi:MAG TPA: L,D-transpeptidase family protein [Acidimicrobiales bacterium]|nr:L,D-transpeptidase family protein [Acidimicrobiales bacterium]